MDIRYATLETCAQATGTVVVIDVLRAFTTAAYALAAGAQEILLTGTVEEALALRERFPGALVMGEVGGLPPAGFDLSNSPATLTAKLPGLALPGRRLVQRTGAGTQGVVRSSQANLLLAASFVCAAATAAYIRRQAPPAVTFVITGQRGAEWGDEDAACADYIAALLLGEQPPAEPYLERVRRSGAGRLIAQSPDPEVPAADLDFATRLDRFDFAMRAERREGLVVLQAVPAG